MDTISKTPGLSKPHKLKSGVVIDLAATEHSGKLTQVKYSKNGWAIVTIAGVTCKGKMNDVHPGALYKLVGKYIENPKFNSWDFDFSECKYEMNANSGLIEYLTREASFCGDKTAQELVKKFGNDTIQIIADSPDRLKEISGLGYEARQKLHDWAKGERKDARVKERLYGIGLLPGLVNRLIRHYGGNAEDKIRADCFSLTEVTGVGFKTVAAIADLLGIPKDDHGRIKAALTHSIGQIYEDGHSCVRRTDLVREACALLELRQEFVNPLLDKMIEDTDLMTEATDFKKYTEEFGIILPS